MPTTMVMASAKKASALKLPPSTWERVPLPQKEQLQQGDGQNEDGDHQLQNPGRLEQALDKV